MRGKAGSDVSCQDRSTNNSQGHRLLPDQICPGYLRSHVRFEIKQIGCVVCRANLKPFFRSDNDASQRPSHVILVTFKQSRLAIYSSFVSSFDVLLKFILVRIEVDITKDHYGISVLDEVYSCFTASSATVEAKSSKKRQPHRPRLRSKTCCWSGFGNLRC